MISGKDDTLHQNIKKSFTHLREIFKFYFLAIKMAKIFFKTSPKMRPFRVKSIGVRLLKSGENPKPFLFYFPKEKIKIHCKKT